ncbi:hypothetical protein KFK09_006678 [Dendrobium nobile]|uniref:Pectinesterase n=1 Tax=Dendrobium nobile TaxID=94219 RepID=A0A8T3BT29_DENNO|nr:hypothetical protein KFK09_006678 [Dendrobium nobile]
MYWWIDYDKTTNSGRLQMNWSSLTGRAGPDFEKNKSRPVPSRPVHCSLYIVVPLDSFLSKRSREPLVVCVYCENPNLLRSSSLRDGGYQDKLCVYSQRQFYRECDIYGTIDFIFGNAAAVIQNCNIIVRTPLKGESNVITAPGPTDGKESTGIVIQFSRITAAQEFWPVHRTMKSYPGWPWLPYSRTVYMQNFIDSIIDPAGWLSLNGDLDTVYYAEYKNTGLGAKAMRLRVKWTGFHIIFRPSDKDHVDSSTELVVACQMKNQKDDVGVVNFLSEVQPFVFANTNLILPVLGVLAVVVLAIALQAAYSDIFMVLHFYARLRFHNLHVFDNSMYKIYVEYECQTIGDWHDDTSDEVRKTRGMGAGRKLKTHRRNQRWADKSYKKSHLGNEWKKPFAGSSSCQRHRIEAKQPNSAIRKCARVQLIKNGKKIAAFVPNDGCLNFIEENDEVLIAGFGRKGHAVGDIPGVRFKVVKVSGVSLLALFKEKKEKPRS